MPTDGRAVSILFAIFQEEGYQLSKSLARRNNNPGNLRKPVGDLPSHSASVPIENGYAHFATAQDGFQSAANLFDECRAQGETLQQFISRWAPPSENDTESYIRLVEILTGISRAETI